MTIETFFEKFALFADAPDAVSKMRGLILRLAMQGKLSEADAHDAPVSDLLRDVERARAKLGLKSAGSAATKAALQEETFSEIPSRWTWVSFGDIARHNAGKTLDKGRNRGELRDYITTSNLYWGFFHLDEVRQMPIQEDELDRCTAIKGDLLIVEGGEAGRAAVWPHDYEISFQNHVHRARFFAGINPYFVQRFFEKLNATGEIEKYRKGVGISNMSGKSLASILLPLPPLAEQKRIVAKVDELMALCDQLEGQQQERETRHAALAHASLARFADAPNPANLEFLFHKSYTITPADLRKLILTLAVQGKLVPQDPKEEPATECLSRLGLKSTVASLNGADNADDLPPPSWARVRFEDVALVAGGVTLGRKLEGRKTVTLPYLRVANVKRGEIDLSVVKDVSIAEDEIQRYALRKNDLLMTEGGDWDKVGRAAIWRGEISVCLHQNHVFRARMRSPEMTPSWFERYFNSPVGRSYFEFASKQTTNLASINMRQVRSCPIPLPPLAEQRRIVVKVDELMALVDQLETQTAASRVVGANLLEAVIAELTEAQPKISEFHLTSQQSSREVARRSEAIACYIISRLYKSPTFGRTQLMKGIYLAEVHAGVDLNGKYERQAAGPFDASIYELEKHAQEQRWFALQKTQTRKGHAQIRYLPMQDLKKKSSEAVVILGEMRQEFDRILDLFEKLNTEEAEIIATLYAAWNDELLMKRSPMDEQIIREVLDNWHDAKKRFSRPVLQTWLNWMRQHQLIPRGSGPRTKLSAM